MLDWLAALQLRFASPLAEQRFSQYEAQFYNVDRLAWAVLLLQWVAGERLAACLKRMLLFGAGFDRQPAPALDGSGRVTSIHTPTLPSIRPLTIYTHLPGGLQSYSSFIATM
jgi:hypothetical protein